MLCLHHPQLASTNDAAAAWARREPGRWLRVTAGTQTRGRGRGGRSWASPRGGLWMSIAAPLRTPLAERGPLPLVVGLAVGDAIAATLELHAAGDRRVEIKWPNDVLLDGGKVAGVLCEQAIDAARDATSAASQVPSATPAVLGVGVNANVRAADLGPGLRRPPATLLETLGRPIDLPAFADRVAAAIRDRVSAWDREGLSEHDVDGLNARLAWRGRLVTARRVDASPTLDRATLVGVDARGRAVLEDAAGRRHSLDAGELAPTASPTLAAVAT